MSRLDDLKDLQAAMDRAIAAESQATPRNVELASQATILIISQCPHLRGLHLLAQIEHLIKWAAIGQKFKREEQRNHNDHQKRLSLERRLQGQTNHIKDIQQRLTDRNIDLIELKADYQKLQTVLAEREAEMKAYMANVTEVEGSLARVSEGTHQAMELITQAYPDLAPLSLQAGIQTVLACLAESEKARGNGLEASREQATIADSKYMRKHADDLRSIISNLERECSLEREKSNAAYRTISEKDLALQALRHELGGVREESSTHWKDRETYKKSFREAQERADVAEKAIANLHESYGADLAMLCGSIGHWSANESTGENVRRCREEARKLRSNLRTLEIRADGFPGAYYSVETVESMARHLLGKAYDPKGPALSQIEDAFKRKKLGEKVADELATELGQTLDKALPHVQALARLIQ